MKRIITLFASLLLVMSYAQEDLEQWKNRKPEERKAIISRMSSAERVKMLNSFKQDMLVDELQVPKERQQEFRNMYDEYEESQKRIKQGFKPRDNYKELSDSEARQELENSFRVGEQLIQNRRNYAEKFQKVVKPQQVLEMFQNEGNMRNKMMERRLEGSKVQGTQGRGQSRFNDGASSGSLRNSSSGNRGFRN